MIYRELISRPLMGLLQNKDY